jgi:hypothetical protein
VYNKPNRCSATGALALGPDRQQPTTGVNLSALILGGKNQENISTI